MSAEAVNPFTAEAVAPAGIDETIAQAEKLYRTLTGHEPVRVTMSEVVREHGAGSAGGRAHPVLLAAGAGPL